MGEPQEPARVKGHKKVRNFKSVLQEIRVREFDRMEYQGISGIDFCLGYLEDQFRKNQEWDQDFKRLGKRGIKGLFKGLNKESL